MVTAVWQDAEIAERLGPAAAVQWIGEAIDAHHCGKLMAPPRVHADFGDGRLVFTAGVQAYAQLWALSAVRELGEVRVYSRDPGHRAEFAERVRPLVAGDSHPVADARAAVADAEIVILATSSPVPVIDAAWLAPGTYVTTLGPKQRGRAEFGLDLPGAAALLVTDSLAQIDAYDPPNVLAGTPYRRRLVSLGAVRAGEVARPTGGGISLFFSVGLAGTEAFLLDCLAASAG